MQDKTFHQLCYYTLSHPGQEFIHQNAVDAYTAQMATADSKPIAVFFALAGLYLHLEKGYTGKQVQNVHIAFSQHTKDYPVFQLPANKGQMTVADVLEFAPGTERDEAIGRWCSSVWEAWCDEWEKLIIQTERLLSEIGSLH